jgi:small-conductance mechanosensitive channel
MDQILTDTESWYRRVLDFQLFSLGDKPFLVSQLILLTLMVAGVFVLELFFRRYVLMRLLGRTRLQTSLQYAISRIARYLVITLGLFIALQTAGINLSSLAIFAGAIGVGVGFGLQNIVSNFMSGLIILAERPIAVGDYVDVGGVGGRVREINLRSTTVVTNDNVSIIVPNTDFISNRVTNFSHGDPKVRVRLPIGIAYGSDVQKFKQAMIQVAQANPDVLKHPEPDVFFVGFGDSSLDFELAVWADDQAFRPLRFKSALYYAVEARLRELDIEIPFPQRDLHIRSSSHRLPVEIERQAAPRSGQAEHPI